MRLPRPSTRIQLTSSLDWLQAEGAPGSSHPPALQDLPPDTRIGPYRICNLIGRGGMGSVYRAFDIEASRLVALKLLNPQLLSDLQSLRRFRQEALLAAQLCDPRIVRVLGYGEDGRQAWLSMELVEGPTLEAVVERQGPLEPDRAARIVAEIARAVAVAHEGGVMHRDLKPGNVLLAEGERPLVLDFGLAKDRLRERSLTGSGEFLGTPVYVAPEMVSSRGRPDERVDVYGLGALLFYSLTGRALYECETPLQVLEAVLRTSPPRVATVAPHLPRDLDRICAQALAREPRDRYPTALAMAQDLERFLARRTVTARPPGRLRLFARAALRRPGLSALVIAACVALLAAPIVATRISAGLARRQRAAQALRVLAAAQRLVEEGRHGEAEQELLHAMLLAKGAFLEDPSDVDLRDALRATKRARAAHAERLGHWELAQELRTNLARLEGASVPLAPVAVSATLRVVGLGPGEAVFVRPWPRSAAARDQALEVEGTLTLDPGAYLALHVGARGLERAYMVTVAAGTTHTLDLRLELSPSQGVWRLPPAAELVDPRPR